MPKKNKTVKQKRHIKLSFMQYALIAVGAVVLLGFFFLWVFDRPSSLMAQMENELSSLNLPEENFTISKDDSGCQSSYFGEICGRSISYNYTSLISKSKGAIIESAKANGWIEKSAITNDDNSLRYVKKINNHYFCLWLLIDRSVDNSIASTISIASDEAHSCERQVRDHLKK